MNEFTFIKNNKYIIIKNNKKYTKFITNVNDLYKYMKSSIIYPLQIFEKIINESINGNSVKYFTKYNENNYYITYSWDGIINGTFDLIIPIIKFKFDKDRFKIDIQNMSDPNAIINYINIILSEFIEEKKYSEFLKYLKEIGKEIVKEIGKENLNKELVYIRNKLSENIQFNTIFNKLGILYPHLSITECKSMTKNYINKGELRVHSGKYIDWEGESGCIIYNNSNLKYNQDWFSIFSKFNIWNCCPTIKIYPIYYKLSHNPCGIQYRIKIKPYDNIIIDNKLMIVFEKYVIGMPIENIPIKTFNEYIKYSVYINLIREQYCRLFNNNKINSKDLTQYIKDYGNSRPDTFCFNSKKLKLK